MNGISYLMKWEELQETNEDFKNFLEYFSHDLNGVVHLLRYAELRHFRPPLLQILKQFFLL